MQPHDTTQNVPYGYCHCGCGQKTNIAKKTHKRSGHIKGEPTKYIMGHQARRSLVERFWRNVKKRGPNECWLYKAVDKSTGYGRVSITQNKHSRMVGSHRFSYELHYGPIPAGMEVCHKCDVRDCVNPTHLFLGTRQANVDDMVAKGRNFVNGEQRPRGERNGVAKLTTAQVLEIRRRAGEDWNDLARTFQVTRGAIYRIVRRDNWKHI